MQAIELETHIHSDGQISLPEASPEEAALRRAIRDVCRYSATLFGFTQSGFFTPWIRAFAAGVRKASRSWLSSHFGFYLVGTSKNWLRSWFDKLTTNVTY